MSEEQTIDITTFRAWLQGVEDMQEEGWVPSGAQWKKIRAKIDLIEEQVVVKQHAPYPMPNQFGQIPRVPADGWAQGQQQPPSSLRIATPPSELNTKPSDNLVDQNGNFNSSFA